MAMKMKMNLREGEEVLSTQFHFNAPAQCECACIQFNIYIVEHIIYLFTLMDGAQGAVAKAKWFFSWRKHWEKKAEIHFWRVARKSFPIKMDNNKQSKRISFVLCVCVCVRQQNFCLNIERHIIVVRCYGFALNGLTCLSCCCTQFTSIHLIW